MQKQELKLMPVAGNVREVMDLIRDDLVWIQAAFNQAINAIDNDTALAFLCLVKKRMKVSVATIEGKS